MTRTAYTLAGILWLGGSAFAADAAFLKDAAQGGMMEVKLGEIAQNNAASQQVKDFGRRMMDDHSRMNAEVQDLAAKQGVSLPSEISMKDKVSASLLAKKTGADFDRAYIENMIRDHKADITAFQKEVDSGTDPEAQALAGKALSTIKAHLKMAQDVARELGFPDQGR